MPEKARHDATRQKHLESLGLTVIRLPNDAVLNSPDTVLEQIAAGKLSLRHVLPMTDAIILATAQAFEATLWTQDAHFKGIDGFKYIVKK